MRNKSNSSKPKIGINFVVLKSNFHEIEKIVELSQKLGVDILMFTSIIISDNTGNLSLWQVKAEQFFPYLERAKIKAAELGLKVISWPSLELRKQKKTGCFYPWLNPYITYNGDVLPCCYIPQMGNARFDSENIMGNILKNTLSEIWNNDKYIEFRKKIKTSSPPKVCRTCSKFYGY
jgi:radical SAM protein with 4Fe4S-binding SPASM domain